MLEHGSEQQDDTLRRTGSSSRFARDLPHPTHHHSVGRLWDQCFGEQESLGMTEEQDHVLCIPCSKEIEKDSSHLVL
jgi:hypothetical protein